MNCVLRIVAAGVLLLALAACNSKPKTPAGQTAPGTAAPATVTAASECPSGAPDKNAVARAIKAAMLQIYGADEGGVQFAVNAVAAAQDCKHFDVTYHASGSAPATAPLIYGDDAKWYLTLYNKPYPVP